MEGVYGIVDKDTGDVLGDTSFVISKRTTAYECRTTQKGSPFCSGLAQFDGDDANSTDLVSAFTIEIDGQWGPYLPCNPDNSSLPLGSWHCSTDIFAPPKNWPKQCTADNVQPFENTCFDAKPLKVLHGVDQGACCDAVSKAAFAKGFTYFAGNQTCELHLGGFHLKSCTGLTGFKEKPEKPACKVCFHRPVLYDWNVP